QISNVPVKNFYKGAEINKENDAYFLSDPNKYQILYINQTNSFLISIIGSPFEDIRQEAEKAFLQKVQLSKVDACKLNVQITTPYYVNPDYSGKTYPLS